MSKCEFERCEGHLGKFDSCRDEAVYNLAMDADWIGSVEWDISAAYLHIDTALYPVGGEDSDTPAVLVEGGFYRAATDNQGFVYVYKFETQEEWDADRIKVEAAWALWDEL
jgi:hypothetical protein